MPILLRRDDSNVRVRIVRNGMPSTARITSCLLATALLADAGRFPVRSLTTSQGLPSNSINGIFQDSRGSIWIATAAGIARFDGRQVQVYAPEGGDVNDYARSFMEDRNGDVWATGTRGLVRFQGPDLDTGGSDSRAGGCPRPDSAPHDLTGP